MLVVALPACFDSSGEAADARLAEPSELAAGACPSPRRAVRVVDALLRAPRSWCDCPRVRITCDGRRGYASADVDDCAIDMLPSTCRTLAIEDGEVRAPQAMFAQTFDAAGSLTAEHVYAVCALAHEVRHVCGGLATTAHCEREVAAYQASLACLAEAQERARAAQRSDLALRVADFAAAQRGALEMNLCLCQSGTTCATCSEACAAAHGPRSTCAEAAAAYCAANGR
jgi:hypothetical protein